MKLIELNVILYLKDEDKKPLEEGEKEVKNLRTQETKISLNTNDIKAVLPMLNAEKHCMVISSIDRFHTLESYESLVERINAQA